MISYVYNFVGEKSQAMLAFSFYTNGMKLLSHTKSKSSDRMDCIHGIRAISTQWIVLGHTYVMFVLLPSRNKTEYPRVNDKLVSNLQFGLNRVY